VSSSPTVRGVGLGLRWEFADELVERRPSASAFVPPGSLPDFLELAPENYIGRGGYHRTLFERAAAQYPIVTHGLTMSVGGSDPLDRGYLRDLAAFVRDVGSPWHSDHLCFGASRGRILHELLPIAFTKRAVRRVADRVKEAQDALSVPFAVENISQYVALPASEMDEPAFLAEVCEAAGCGLMLDVNNAHVNATNFGFDARDWLARAPLERAVQIHVAGGEWVTDDDGERVLIDTHGADVPDPVMDLLAVALRRTGPVPVLVERDTSIPPLDALLREVARVRAAVADALESRDRARAGSSTLRGP